jgi:PAS domain-containing protein
MNPAEVLDQQFRSQALELIDHFRVGVLLVDGDHRVMHVNRWILERYHLEQHEARRHKCWQLLGVEPPACTEPTGDSRLVTTRDEAPPRHLVVNSSALAENLTLNIVQEITELAEELQAIRQELQELRSLLEATLGGTDFVPICCACRKIRLADGSWVHPGDVENIRYNAGLTHGYCPGCARDLLESLKRKTGATLRQRQGPSEDSPDNAD